MVPEVSHHSVPAGVLILLMAVMVNLPAVSNEENLAPVQAPEHININKVINTLNTKMPKLTKPFDCWNLELSKLNEPRSRGYRNARVYTIQTDHPPAHTPMHHPPLNSLTGLNHQQHTQQELGPCISCDQLGHICTFSPNVHTDQEQGIVHLNGCRRPT